MRFPGGNRLVEFGQNDRREDAPHFIIVNTRRGLFASLTKDRIKLNCIDRVICRPCFNQSKRGLTMTIILFITSYIIPSSLILFMNYQIIIYLEKAQTVRKDYIMKAPPPPRAIVRVNSGINGRERSIVIWPVLRRRNRKIHPP